ncbi:MAG: acyl-CoA dehydrogenase family protein [Thermoanaerobaculia bacterium]
MNFEIDEAQSRRRSEIVAFARERLNADVAGRDARSEFARGLWRECARLGLQGLPVETRWGGLGLDPLSTVLALEAFGYGCEDGGLVFAIGAHLCSCVVPIAVFGTDEQKERYLRPLADGRSIGALAITEAESGSDVFAMRTSAVRAGEGFRLAGRKSYVSSAPEADLILLFALSDAEKGALGGVTAFLVERGLPGLQVSEPLSKMGLRTVAMGEIDLADVPVGSGAVLGGVGGGAAVFALAMAWERVGLFAGRIGALERVLERVVERARTRRQSGKPIGEFQAVSHRIAEMKVRLEAGRLLIYRAAAGLSRGQGAFVDASIAKLFVSEACLASALDAVRTFAAEGYLSGHESERMLRDSVAGTIYSGTSDVQRNIISRSLGLGGSVGRK